jgi:CHAT domain-containing protein
MGHDLPLAWGLALRFKLQWPSDRVPNTFLNKPEFMMKRQNRRVRTTGFGLACAIALSLAGVGPLAAQIDQPPPPPPDPPPSNDQSPPAGLEDITVPSPGEGAPITPGGAPVGLPPSLSGEPSQIIEAVETYQSLTYANHLKVRLYGELVNFEQISQTLKRIGRKTGTNPALVYVLETRQGLGIVLVLPDETLESIQSNLQKSFMGFKLASTQLSSTLAQQPSTPDKPSNLIYRLITDVSPAAVKRAVKTFRSDISDPGKVTTTRYQTAAKQLYDWIIAPIKPTLDAHKIDTLAFSMDKGFRSMPVAALYDGQQFLVEQYNLALIPSFSLTDTRFQAVQGTKMLGMGITQSAGGLAPLPAVAVEVPTLTSQIWQGQGYLDQQVTLEQFRTLTRREQFGIIHLATHAEFNSGNINKSFIQFWDGRLTLPDLRTVALNQSWSTAPTIEMLVLSACQTALGNEQAELGFTGLAVQTGVKTAIGSLWSVSDEGTLGLMSEFYRQLKTAPIRAAALRQAQIGLLRAQVKVKDGQLQLADGSQIALPPAIAQRKDIELSHPYYWAAYTLVGNWN